MRWNLWLITGLLALLLHARLFAAEAPAGGPSTNAATVSVPQTGTTVEVRAVGEREVYLSFGLDRIELLRREVPKGIPLWQYIASLIYIFLAFYISKALDHLTRVYLRKWAEKTRTRFDDVLLSLLNGPIKIISFVVLLHIGLRVFIWPQWAEDFLSKGLGIVVAFSLTYLALKSADMAVGYWQARSTTTGDKPFDAQLFPIITKSLRVFIIVVSVLVTSQNLGLNITGLIASLSIGGLALGLAAQDTVANLFGAVAVFVDKPFRVGDRVKFADVDGIVEAIGLRSTRVRNLDGHVITVPNKTMGNASITNISGRPNIKTEMNIGLTYDTTTEKVREALAILKDVYSRSPMTQDLMLSFNRFADSSLNLNVVHWWSNTDYRAYLAGMQDFNLEIKDRFAQAGIEFAFPTRTLYVKQDSKWAFNAAGAESEPPPAAPPEKRA